jgi:hypothetical protein
MNWTQVIARNRTALMAIVSAIIALIGGREGGPIARHLRNAALALLRPAEAAARRLIVMSARGLEMAPRPRPVFPAGFGARGQYGAASASLPRPPAFRLFDRRKRFGRLLLPLKPVGIPRIRTFWGAPLPVARVTPAVAATRPDPAASVEATRLRLRTAALERALADLPRQARRLARWRARQLPGPGGRAGSPLRLGHPPGLSSGPGLRDGGVPAVDAVLRQCHALALDVLAGDGLCLNTS